MLSIKCPPRPLSDVPLPAGAPRPEAAASVRPLHARGGVGATVHQEPGQAGGVGRPAPGVRALRRLAERGAQERVSTADGLSSVRRTGGQSCTSDWRGFTGLFLLLFLFCFVFYFETQKSKSQDL